MAAMLARSIALVLLMAAPLWCQSDAVLEPLRAGDLNAAMKVLDSGARVSGPEAQIEGARLLFELAPARAGGVGAQRRERALSYAFEMLPHKVPSDLRSARDDLAVRVGLDLAELLKEDGSQPDRAAFKLRVRALEAALAGMHSQRRDESRAAVEATLELVPLLLAKKSYSQTAALCRELLAGELTPDERTSVRGSCGVALLYGKRTADAVPYLSDYIAREPRDPEHVLPVIDALPSKYAGEVIQFGEPVIGLDPPQAKLEAWRSCLEVFYRNISSKTEKQPDVAEFVESRTVAKPIPRQWGYARWGEGYRVYRPDGQNPGRQYGGSRGISATLPASVGWQQRAAPPAALRRWGNHAVCFQRGRGGPTLVIYWFAPDLGYWYGTTPRQAGVTGKTVRGFNRGGIAKLVADTAYGIEAKKLGRGLRKSTPLPFKPRVPGAVRKQWRVGDTLFDETFFSMGQVTGEVLLVIDKDDLELLEPEIRWLYQHVRAER